MVQCSTVSRSSLQAVSPMHPTLVREPFHRAVTAPSRWGARDVRLRAQFNEKLSGAANRLGIAVDEGGQLAQRPDRLSRFHSQPRPSR